MSDAALEDSDLLAQVFFGYAKERMEAIRISATRFAYYTTAATAYQILESRKIWLRNAKLMNDFSEIGHGFQCLGAAFAGESGDRFRAALDSCLPGLSSEIPGLFATLVPNLELDTFLACVSEHLPEEDRSGRLSMWRAYGGSTGVALVVTGDAMLGNSSATSVLSSPVLYATPESFVRSFARITDSISANAQRLRSLGSDSLKRAVLHMLRFAVLGTKHPGFAEEREWRIIASPTITGTQRVERATEIIDGIPQTVLKLPLENAPEDGLVSLAIPQLVDRVIIGPCAFPQVTYLAFVDLLIALGVPDPGERVIVTDIPLRHDA